jgi:putative drug exporter of the RND superfamily
MTGPLYRTGRFCAAAAGPAGAAGRNGNAIVKQFAVGLAAAIAIDATIVRCLAVPAVMALFGRAAWWLPRGVDRALPKISIEGEEYFEEERDRRRVPAET